MFRIYDGRNSFWQWDVNQKLIVDIDVPCQVHFCNGTSDCSLVVEAEKDEQGQYIANVPNVLLQTANKISVFAYICDGSEEYTKHEQWFAVLPRTKPEDYIYTPEEIKTWDALKDSVAGLEKADEALQQSVAELEKADAALQKSVKNVQKTADDLNKTCADLAADMQGLDARLSVVEGTTSWLLIRDAVRTGKAKELYPVGTQFLVKNSLVGDFLYDVVAHDHFKSADDENAHTMTLMCHDIVPTDVPYDVAEAFSSTYLSNGAYSFGLLKTEGSWQKGYYWFPISKAQATNKKGKLRLSSEQGYPTKTLPLTQHYVVSPVGTTSEIHGPFDTYSELYKACAATPIGTFGSMTSSDNKVNYVGRILNGSNNYKSSAIREVVLHSAADKLNGSQATFDMPYDGKCNFVDGFDPAFLAVVGKVIVPCDTCNTYEPYGTALDSAYELEETFFLPSMQEITGESNGAGDNSAQLEYFKGTAAVDRIKYLNNVAQAYYTRSPYQPSAKSSAHTVRVITNKGAVSNFAGTTARGVVPMCNIVG